MEPKLILSELRKFVEDEHEANDFKLLEGWQKPLGKKLETGETQLLTHLTKAEEKGAIWAFLGEGESRFREGDMVCIHTGDALHKRFLRQLSIEKEEEDRWLLTGFNLEHQFVNYQGGNCYADADSMDLKPFYEKALDELAVSRIGREIVLPLIAGQLNINDMYSDDYDSAAEMAESEQLNEEQVDAVACAVGARYVACIQGPPGTGKTKVLSLIAKILVSRGERVLMTSHTHMAINNALNKIYAQNVPAIKVGVKSGKKELNPEIDIFGTADDWKERPCGGYVIGATPFATCSSRLEKYEFDTVIFDEASQVTVPLAVMAMRKAKKYIFIGDHKQLPPVVLSRSILDSSSFSIFAKLVDEKCDTSVSLKKTYRMNQWITRWPSETFYGGNVVSDGQNKSRRLKLKGSPARFHDILSSEHSVVFIGSTTPSARTVNTKDAKFVKDIIAEAIDCGLDAGEIGIVTPFRNHARKIRTELVRELGAQEAEKIVADTVERMQGQERELIILSLCATDTLFLHTIAPFFFQPERLNVAVTRPMIKLIIIGPEIDADFYVENDKVNQWIKWYRNLTSQAKKVYQD